MKPEQLELKSLAEKVENISLLAAEDRKLLKEIHNQNKVILECLAHSKGQAITANSDDNYASEFPLNVSEILRADDPLQYIRNRNAEIKASKRLRKRSE